MTIVINILIAIAVLGVLGFIFGAACSVAGCGKADEKAQDDCKEAERTESESSAAPAEEAKLVRAFVKCAGDEAERKFTYVGEADCFAASILAGGYKSCEYSCLGLGSCAGVCESGAISVKDSLAEVDAEKCTGCGKCAEVCPRGVIEMVPQDAKFKVRCNNADLGGHTREICEIGCIGCLACAKNCKYEAITVENSIAHVDYSKCEGCGECADVCLRGIITSLPEAEAEEEPFDEAEYFALKIEEDSDAEEEVTAEKQGE